MLADRVFLGEKAAGKSLIDEGNRRRGLVIKVCERTSSGQRNFHSLQVVRTNYVVSGLWTFLRRSARLPFDNEWDSTRLRREWQVHGSRSGYGAGEVPEFLRHLLEEGGLLRWTPVFGGGQGNFRPQEFSRIEAGVGAYGFEKALNHQPRSRQ